MTEKTATEKFAEKAGAWSGRIFVGVVIILIVIGMFWGLDVVIPTAAEIEAWGWKTVAVVCAGIIAVGLWLGGR